MLEIHKSDLWFAEIAFSQGIEELQLVRAGRVCEYPYRWSVAVALRGLLGAVHSTSLLLSCVIRELVLTGLSVVERELVQV